MKRTHDDWRSSIPRLLAIADLVCVSVAVVVAQLTRFGASSEPELAGTAPTSYWLVTVLIGLVWWAALAGWQSRDVKILGAGAEEYKRVAVASLYLFGGIAIVSYAAKISTARGYVGVALPLGLFLLLVSRWCMRKWLVRSRASGRFTRRILLIGAPSAVEHLHENLSSAFGAGFTPVAAILPGHSLRSPTGPELQLPVVSVSSDLPAVLNAIEETNADAIAISAGSRLKPRVIQELGWELQDRGVSMIMAPALTGVAGPRIHTQPIAGLPLIHVSTPKLAGMQALAKRTFDIFGATALIALLSPLLLLIAVAVKLSSPGPVLYSQRRVGKNGDPFSMLKFRSMQPNADQLLQELLLAQGTSDKPLFKVENDPRVTRIGRVLRQYSLDEFPQLFNVLNGTMSLVGPRPQRDAEVALYDHYAHRRHIVQPGMSGLWQVSGRSNLSWDEAIRLDLYYVENWSFVGDIAILFKTFSAVLQKDGAV